MNRWECGNVGVVSPWAERLGLERTSLEGKMAVGLGR